MFRGQAPVSVMRCIDAFRGQATVPVMRCIHACVGMLCVVALYIFQRHQLVFSTNWDSNQIVYKTAFACNVQMDSTTLANLDESKDYAYLRKGAVDFFAGANQWYNRKAYIEMQERHLYEKRDIIDMTAMMTRCINRQREQMESFKTQLRVMNESIVAIHSMQEMYTTQLEENEHQCAALAEEIRGIETQNMRLGPGSCKIR